MNNKHSKFTSVGFYAGLLFGVVEIISVFQLNDPRLSLVSEISKLILFTLIYYTVIGVFLSHTIGRLTLFLINLNKIKLDSQKTTHTILFFTVSSIFIFFSVFAKTDIYIQGRWLIASFWKAMFTSLLMSISVTYLWHKALYLKQVSKKTISLTLIFIFVLTTFIFWRINSSSTSIQKIKTDNPNILWIVMDTVRSDRLSINGYERDTTPNVDKIAQGGVTYLNSISPSTWTLPSHASMLTGIFPSKHGADGSWQWLSNNFISIAEILKSEGYNTYGVSNADSFSQLTNLDQGFDKFVYVPRNPSPLAEISVIKSLEKIINIFLINKGFIKDTYNFLSFTPFEKPDAGASVSNKLAESYVSESIKQDRPFFLFVNYVEAHRPYGDTANYSKYLEDEDLNDKKYQDVSVKIGDDPRWYYPQPNVKMDDNDKRIINSLYDGDINYLDQKIGELVEYLKNNNSFENTLIIITSDHGENLGSGNIVNHVYSSSRELTHVPLIIRYPELFKSGQMSSSIVQTTDIFPTILDVIKNNEFDRSELQGHSLLSKNRPQVAYSEGKNIQPPQYESIFSEYYGLEEAVIGLESRSIQDERYEYIEISDKLYYLYDLKVDPKELNNIINDMPQKANELKRNLNNWLYSFKHYF